MPWALRVSWSDSHGRSVGTAVALSPGLVVTCEHVVRGTESVTVRTPSGSQLAFDVAGRDRDLDVALLRPAKGERGQIEPEAVVIPRRMWRGRWPSVSAEQNVWAESCTSEAETSRRTEVAVQRGHPSERWVQFGVVDDRQGARHGHSGGPVLELGRLSPRPRLVGVVRARDEQTRDLLDGAGAGWLVPVERIAERFG